MMLSLMALAAGWASSAATPGATVQTALTSAIAGGAPTFQLPAGDVTFNGTDFTIADASHMVITGHATTTLWFDAGYGLRVYSCENVTVGSVTIDYWVLPYVQATVISVSEAQASRLRGGDGGGTTTYKLQLAPRSAAPESIIPLLNLANPAHFWRAPDGQVDKAMLSGTISTCVIGATGPFPTGLKPCPPVQFTKAVGDTFTITVPTADGTNGPHGSLKPGGTAAVGDFVTFKAGLGHTYVVGNCSQMRTEALTIRAAGWMAVYEVDGEGGNVYDSITIEPGPGYLIGSNADGFHSTDVAVGPTLTNSRLTNIENDFFSTHTTMHILVGKGDRGYQLIDPRAFAFGNRAGALVDEWYGTSSPLANTKVGDALSCYDFNSFALKLRTTLTALSEFTDPYVVHEVMQIAPGVAVNDINHRGHGLPDLAPPMQVLRRLPLLAAKLPARNRAADLRACVRVACRAGHPSSSGTSRSPCPTRRPSLCSAPSASARWIASRARARRSPATTSQTARPCSGAPSPAVP